MLLLDANYNYYSTITIHRKKTGEAHKLKRKNSRKTRFNLILVSSGLSGVRAIYETKIESNIFKVCWCWSTSRNVFEVKWKVPLINDRLMKSIVIKFNIKRMNEKLSWNSWVSSVQPNSQAFIFHSKELICTPSEIM